jgi:hypothetical protein
VLVDANCGHTSVSVQSKNGYHVFGDAEETWRYKW